MNTPLSFSQPFSADSDAFTRAADAVNFIGGRFVAPDPALGRLPIHNPRHGRAMAEVHLSGAAEVDAAVAAAELIN